MTGEREGGRREMGTAPGPEAAAAADKRSYRLGAARRKDKAKDTGAFRER